MTIPKSWMVVAALVAAGPIGICADSVATQSRAPAPAPREIRFQEQIAAFVEQDRTNPPPQRAILFIGSSIFRQWTNVKDHMSPLPAFNRGFGGSRTWEILHYMDKIVLPYRPRIIVYYGGSNDVNAGESAPAIVGRIKEFVSRTHAVLPDTRIYYVSINKAPQKRDRWNVVEQVNADVKALADASADLDYIDVNPVLFNSAGEPRVELYRDDGLHFHPPAYDEFAKIIKPVLTQAWKTLAGR